jgi:2-polyprenyl-3-methyl-5-hydroxy-6-metoxy-1,4-benzoquinol methylase
MREAANHHYDDRFFDYIERGARRSARYIIPFLRRHLNLSSIVDIGCGRGVWLEEWRRSGVEEVVGVDGDYVRVDRLLISQERFVAVDLSKPILLGRRFDLAQSLEVAEHIPGARADVFIR